MIAAPRITLVAGPTASGKSAWALARACEIEAVILNADSQQLYSDLRVLSARPSPEDEATVEHRLYGVADAAEAWSVGRWSRAAVAELAKLEDRPVLIVGGTGLYFTALTKGLADIPDVSKATRDEAEARLEAEGETAFRRALADRDPAAATRIEAGDRQRLIRALAVAEHTGRSLSQWTADTTPLLEPGSWDGVVIEPERGELYARCDARVAWMVEHGAVGEVERLITRGLDPALPAMKAVGVRAFAGHLGGETTLGEAMAATRQATRNYAKRQLTWFRNQTPDWRRIAP